MVKIKSLLIQPPQYLAHKFKGAFDYVRLKQPLGLTTLKLNVNNPNSKIVVFDAMAENFNNRVLNKEKGILKVGTCLDNIIKKIEEEKPDLVGVSSLWSSNYPAAREIIALVKELFPNIKTILGGVHPSFSYKNILENDEADFVAIREATIGFSELIDYLVGEKTWHEVSGIATKIGGVIREPKPTKVIDLKQLKPIDYNLFPVEFYSQQKKFGFSSAKNADVITSLGCPNNCDYCSTKKMWPGKYRTFSDHQLNFMFDSIKEAGFDFVSLQDDNFAANPEYAKLVMKKLKERNLPWHWEGGVEVKLLPKIIDDLADSSCVAVDMAIETAKKNNSIYDKFSRGIEKSLNKSLAIFKKSHIFVNSNFMLGIPSESKADMEETIKYALTLKEKGLLDHANFHLTMAFPGTDFANHIYELPKSYAPEEFFGYSAVVGNVPHKDFTRVELISFRNEADKLVNGEQLYAQKQMELNRY